MPVDSKVVSIFNKQSLWNTHLDLKSFFIDVFVYKTKRFMGNSSIQGIFKSLLLLGHIT